MSLSPQLSSPASAFTFFFRMTLCVFGDTSKTSSAQVTALWEVTGLPLPSCKLRWNKWVHMYTRARVRAKQKPLLTNKRAGWCQSSRYLANWRKKKTQVIRKRLCLKTHKQTNRNHEVKAWQDTGVEPLLPLHKLGLIGEHKILAFFLSS